MASLLTNGAFQNFPELRLWFVLSKDKPVSSLATPPGPVAFLYCTAGSGYCLPGLCYGMSNPAETEVRHPYPEWSLMWESPDSHAYPSLTWLAAPEKWREFSVP